jgi:hypothetical protein
MVSPTDTHIYISYNSYGPKGQIHQNLQDEANRLRFQFFPLGRPLKHHENVRTSIEADFAEFVDQDVERCHLI